MTVHEILAAAGLKSSLPPSLRDAAVAGIDYDSRRIERGFLFFAFPGRRTDGREYAGQALERGALAVVSELPPPVGFQGPWIVVEHGRRALAAAARAFYLEGRPTPVLTGITGTNGKTTTSYVIDAVLREAGFLTAVVGTIEYHVAGEVRPAVNTTPESVDLYRILDELRGKGGDHATMEVSSHALALGRVYGVPFHTAVFTNFTRDHLDFHGTMGQYFAAKQLLFQGNGTAPPEWAVLNADDESARRLRLAPETRVCWYGIESESAPGPGELLRARNIEAGFAGLRFEVCSEDRSFEVASLLVGDINVYNILAACGAGLSLGLAPDVIARGVAACRAVPGRFERVEAGQPFLVVVDYAHTDDALRNTIRVARSLSPRRVITLFGCGGDRDRTKRPLMAMAAASLSDFVVLTSDNPRSEDPLSILTDAMVGLNRFETPRVVEPDREKAIRRAIEEAGRDDIVILAGKGHETYQILKDRTIHFDDREVAAGILRGFGYRKEGQ